MSFPWAKTLSPTLKKFWGSLPLAVTNNEIVSYGCLEVGHSKVWGLKATDETVVEFGV
jgi:hypothetical protein